MKILTIETYNQHKNEDRFLHAVRHAHGTDGYGWGDDKIALTEYTSAKKDFRVTSDIINKAIVDYDERKREILNNIGSKLIFVGMGMDFTPSTPNHVGNHRIRTYFKNKDGVLCFVEFGSVLTE